MKFARSFPSIPLRMRIAASIALLVDIITQLDLSGFLAVDAYSEKVLSDIETLREHYAALLASVRQQGVRIGQRDAALRTSRPDKISQPLKLIWNVTKRRFVLLVENLQPLKLLLMSLMLVRMMLPLLKSEPL